MKAIDYCVRVFDGTHDTPKPTEKGYKLITSKNILNRTLNLDDAYYISESDYISINKRSKVKQWDILFSMIGTVGNVYLEQNKDITYAIKNMGVFSCEDENKALWLYYYLQSPYFKQYLNSYLSGAVQKFVPLDFLRNIEVPDCTEETIRKCSVLSTLDRKISLNRSINAELERMAKEVYDYWFVQFDFPDEHGRPYKSSGGAMVYNPVLKREVPEGWEVKNLDYYLSSISERTSIIEDSHANYTPIEVIPRKKMSFHETVPLEKAVSGLCKYNKKDILLSNRRVYFHKVSIVPFNGVTRDTVIILRPKFEDSLGYSFQLVNSDHFIAFATKHSYGSEQPVLSWETAKKYKVCVPPKDIVLSYNRKISSCIDSILDNEIESGELTKLRDELLPLLMTGQVKIK